MTGFLGMQISDLTTRNTQTPFLLIFSLLLFQHRQTKILINSYLKVNAEEVVSCFLARTILIKTNCGIIFKKITTFFNLKDISKGVRTNN